jgi:ETC complex I subunit conserved region
MGITEQVPEGCSYTTSAIFATRFLPHLLRDLTFMTARIFKPAKNAMQSGIAKTREWQLDYEPEQPRAIEPLMGWTSSGDMKQQLTIRFDTKEDAVAYCEREGIPYQVIEPKAPTRRQAAYADNFAFRRGEPWTH